MDKATPVTSNTPPFSSNQHELDGWRGTETGALVAKDSSIWRITIEFNTPGLCWCDWTNSWMRANSALVNSVILSIKTTWTKVRLRTESNTISLHAASRPPSTDSIGICVRIDSWSRFYQSAEYQNQTCNSQIDEREPRLSTTHTLRKSLILEINSWSIKHDLRCSIGATSSPTLHIREWIEKVQCGDWLELFMCNWESKCALSDMTLISSPSS